MTRKRKPRFDEMDGLDEVEVNGLRERLRMVDEALKAKAGDNTLETDEFMKAHQRETETRIRRRVLEHLLYFAIKQNTAPVLITMLTPLLESLWNLVDEVTTDYQVAGKQTVKQWRKQMKAVMKETEIEGDLEEMKERTGKILSVKTGRVLHTMHGVPLWRMNTKLRQNWNDFVASLAAQNKARKILADNTQYKQVRRREAGLPQKTAIEESPAERNFDATVAVIKAILSSSPDKVIKNDIKSKLIEVEWLRDVIYDVIEMISFAPTYAHERIGVKVRFTF